MFGEPVGFAPFRLDFLWFAGWYFLSFCSPRRWVLWLSLGLLGWLFSGVWRHRPVLFYNAPALLPSVFHFHGCVSVFLPSNVYPVGFLSSACRNLPGLHRSCWRHRPKSLWVTRFSWRFRMQKTNPVSRSPVGKAATSDGCHKAWPRLQFRKLKRQNVLNWCSVSWWHLSFGYYLKHLKWLQLSLRPAWVRFPYRTRRSG